MPKAHRKLTKQINDQNLSLQLTWVVALHMVYSAKDGSAFDLPIEGAKNGLWALYNMKKEIRVDYA